MPKNMIFLLSLLIAATVPVAAKERLLWGGDVLNEVPLVPIPEEMTYDEYRDMNRRLSVGLALKVIPLPGGMHFYAGETRTGRQLLYASLFGVTSIVAGAVLMDEGDFPKSEFEVEVLNAGEGKRERRYEKIPVALDGETPQFKLHEIKRKRESALGGTLIAVGVLTLVADYVYDFVHGIQVIEEKRDRVRFKYGRQLGMQLGARPGAAGAVPTVGLTYNF